MPAHPKYVVLTIGRDPTNGWWHKNNMDIDETMGQYH